MNLKIMTNPELHKSFERVAHTERKITGLILDHINEVESRKLYLEFGYASLYTYMVKAMKYSESCAYRRIAAARLIKGHSEITEKIHSGDLNLTHLTELSKGLNKVGKQIEEVKVQELVRELENKGTFESQHIIAAALSLPIEQTTKVKPQRDESVRIEVTLTKEQFEELKKAQDLLSHVVIDGNWAEVIATLANKFNQTKLGKTGVRQNMPQGLSAKQFSKKSKTTRKYISVKIKRELLQVAHYQCQFRGIHGERCQCTYQLQIDHIIPLAKGGADHSSNMRILCSAHNRAEARSWGLGINNQAEAHRGGLHKPGNLH